MRLTGRAFTFFVVMFTIWPVSGCMAAGDTLAPMSALVGDWTGVGEGQPGVSAASRHGERVQDSRYILVQGRSVYPRQKGNPTGEIHTSIDLWSYDRQRGLIILRQFDNLGFISTYAQDRAASTGNRIVLLSEHLENVPVGWKARYTYEFPGPDEYHELFELDMNGQGFKTYVTGKFLRTQQKPGL